MVNSLYKITTTSPEETMAVGEGLARWLHQGSVVALRGGLGVGKTYLTKGIARGLGVQEEVTSPTYTMIAEYQGTLPFYHIDAYRLEGDADFSSLGAEELLYGPGVTVIEWSERIPQSIPKDAFIVEITIQEQDQRLITLRNMPE
ncbi:MAG: tRNA (adenosine(37)-N6)-threonylcarbamoyltransferase complex ATPase subunit type 1 TsaE [Treponema sp.]|jgi:tRNA threonylcarbamoyladenosine biosynthesis protein TsaE|nr:tRNA (adenosine(37)-N6)-threonylcarbamoyltransferase complex ATPase subunit type 1 TsaE [Treponema sp.]